MDTRLDKVFGKLNLDDNAFDEGSTINDVLSFREQNGDVAYQRKCVSSGFLPIEFENHLDSLPLSIEKKLHSVNFLSNHQAEFNVIKDRFRKDCCSFVTRHFEPGTEIKGRNNTRELDIHAVLGPSGSGKTFFATRFLPKWQIEAELACTVHCVLCADDHVGKIVSEVCRQLEEAAEARITTELKMHLTVVLDEAS